MTTKKILMPDGELRAGELPQWKTPWNHDTNLESDRTAIYCPEPSLTKQEFKEETDINVILARFMRNGEPPPIVLPEHFADTTTKKTYHEMASAVAEANTRFYLLPADERAKHQNDPTRWADAVLEALNRGDRDQLGKLGIDVPPETPLAADQADPLPEDSPARKPAQKPPGSDTQGKTPATPESDTKK